MSRHGHIWWDEINTWDPEKTKAFYAGLLGWTFTDMPMPGGEGAYIIIQRDDAVIGGLLTMTSPDFDGLNPHWMPYFAVDDIAATAATVKDAGGAVRHGPFEIPTVGHVAVVADPSDAVVCLIQPPNGEAPLDRSNTRNAVCWREIDTWDPEAVKTFWSKVLGWTFATSPSPHGGQYAEATIDGTKVAGVFPLSKPAFEGVPSHWFTFLQVDDADAAAAKTVALGGQVVRPPFSAPNGARMVVIQDAAGAFVGLMQPAE